MPRHGYVEVWGEDASGRRCVVRHTPEAEAARLPRCTQCGKPFVPEGPDQDACSRSCVRAYVVGKYKCRPEGLDTRVRFRGAVRGGER